MKSTVVLLTLGILADAEILCSTPLERDKKTILSRVKYEGESFLTITLPAFCKAFERALDEGRLDPSSFPWFRKVSNRKGGVIPEFLQGILIKIFDEEGRIRTDVLPEYVDSVRQICLPFNKLKKECTNARQRKAEKAFVQCESDLRSFRYEKWHLANYFRSVAYLSFDRLFDRLQRKLDNIELRPKNGPGAVVERFSANEKFAKMNWTRRLDRYLPLDSYRYANIDHLLSEEDNCRLLDLGDEPPARVVFVPKTQKSPRVIAIEPTHMQYAQQAFMRALVPLLEEDPLVGSSIHFTDGSINGRAARIASMDRKMATLDMSEASDRVHGALAYNLYRCKSILARAIFSCRTKYATLPSGFTIPLKKFASMGSALCFPTEAMVFYTIAMCQMLKNRSLPLTRKSLFSLKRSIHVFGDDLIIPVEDVPSVIEALESAGLKVNRQKSFSSGFFRESCGVDAYRGHLVTPVYFRETLPRNRSEASKFLSSVATANLFYKKGYWKTAQIMRDEISKVFGDQPHVTETSSAVGWFSYLGSKTVERWNPRLQRFEFRGFKPRVRNKVDPIEGYNRLLKFFLYRGEEPLHENEKSVVRSSTYTKMSWSPSY